MCPKTFSVYALCITAAFVLIWTGHEGGIAFLTLLADNPASKTPPTISGGKV